VTFSLNLPGLSFSNLCPGFTQAQSHVIVTWQYVFVPEYNAICFKLVGSPLDISTTALARWRCWHNSQSSCQLWGGTIGTDQHLRHTTLHSQTTQYSQKTNLIQRVQQWWKMDNSVAQKTKSWKCMAPQGCPCYT